MESFEMSLARQHTADLVRDAQAYRLRASAPPRRRTSTTALTDLGLARTTVLQRLRRLVPAAPLGSAGSAQVCCA